MGSRVGVGSIGRGAVGLYWSSHWAVAKATYARDRVRSWDLGLGPVGGFASGLGSG